MEEKAEQQTARPSPRVVRKRERARSKILAAAEELMRTRPIEEVTVGDITDAADVGHGTFYLHFQSKFDVLVPVARAHATALANRLSELTRDIEDPAEVVAISGRHILRAIERDPLWSWFIFRSGLPADSLREGVLVSAGRDMLRGRETGRFHFADPDTISGFLAGAVIGFMTDRLAGRIEDDKVETAVAHLLMALGVPHDEAAEIVARPLPELPSET